MVQSVPVNLDPPKELAYIAMRVIAHWAYIEFLLQMTAYELLDLDAKKGRVAVRDPRPDQYHSMYIELLGLSNIEIGPDSSKFLKELSGNLRECRAARDLIAHGVWAKNPETGADVIRNISGKWHATQNSAAVNRRIIPEGEIVTAEILEHVRRCMHVLIESLQAFRAQVGQSLSSHEKLP